MVKNSLEESMVGEDVNVLLHEHNSSSNKEYELFSILPGMSLSRAYLEEK